MELKEGHFYHIYNQGNNRKKIFFSKQNYTFFLEKINEYLFPYCDILAWCLMPNHFHVLVFIKSEILTINEKENTINSSIGIILRSYTRAINIQNNWTGSLFRQKTKASHIEIAEYENSNKNKRPYLNECFNYIILNPVKDELVKEPQMWEFSSYSDTIGIREPRLINLELIKKMELTVDHLAP